MRWQIFVHSPVPFDLFSLSPLINKYHDEKWIMEVKTKQRIYTFSGQSWWASRVEANWVKGGAKDLVRSLILYF